MIVTHICAASHSTHPDARPPGRGSSTWTVELHTDLADLADDPDARWLAENHPRRVWGLHRNPAGLVVYDGRSQADVERQARPEPAVEGVIRAYGMETMPAACDLLMPCVDAGMTGADYWRSVIRMLRALDAQAVRCGEDRAIRFL
jgi:hypothetical protein